MRCAVYARVSTDEQDFTRQLDELRAFTDRVKTCFPHLKALFSDKGTPK